MATPVSDPFDAVAGPVAGGDDAAIIAESLADPERFAVLYDRYADQLYRYAGRRLGHVGSENMAAATFLAAFRARSRFDTTCTEGSCLRATVRRSRVSMHRWTRRMADCWRCGSAWSARTLACPAGSL
jgi:DNA-directed RNA polymerase specialized sigma24 family protein